MKNTKNKTYLPIIIISIVIVLLFIVFINYFGNKVKEHNCEYYKIQKEIGKEYCASYSNKVSIFNGFYKKIECYYDCYTTDIKNSATAKEGTENDNAIFECRNGLAEKDVENIAYNGVTKVFMKNIDFFIDKNCNIK